MNAFLHHAAGAALPVAFGLLILAATARAALWADLDDRRTRSVAAQYLGPLSTWCMVAVAVYVVALAAAGAAGLPALGLALGLCAAAVAVRLSAEQDVPVAAPAVAGRRPWGAPASDSPRPAAAPVSAPAARPAADPPAPSSPAAHPRGLWDEPADDETRSGLWSR